MNNITNARGYPIGEVSKRTGVSIETIRYYERIKRKTHGLWNQKP